MSTQNAVQFLEAAWKDEDLMNRVRGQKSAEDVISIASEEGYEFSADEFQEAQIEIVDKYDIELSEEALEGAAGGICSVLSNTGQNDCSCSHKEAIR